MSSIRSILADALVAGLDTRYSVSGYPRDPDTIVGDTRPVCVWTDSLTRGSTMRRVRVVAVVWVLTGSQDVNETTEDELEDSLTDVLGVLDNAAETGTAFVWTTATRDVMNDTWHGYRIEVTALGSILPPEPAPLDLDPPPPLPLASLPDPDIEPYPQKEPVA